MSRPTPAQAMAPLAPEWDVAQWFNSDAPLSLAGLRGRVHTVFEHHEAMRPVSLQAYIFENRLRFPIGVDQPGGQGGLPQTMRAYGMQGTPTLVLIDRQGRVRQHAFGHVGDLALGVAIGTLLAEPAG